MDDSTAVALDRKLAKVLESRMRMTLVRESLLELGPEAACALLDTVLQRVPPPSPGSDILRDAVFELLTAAHGEPGSGCIEPLPYAFRRDVYAAALAGELESVARLLRTLPASDEEAGYKRLPPEIAEIPLGRRRSLAKGEDPYLLEKLALDPDPMVIANLLRNPRIREQDVVRIAAMRPAPVSTLHQIDRSKRWSHQPRVRVALARNPHCPVELAIKLIGTLPLPDLREMQHDPGLHDEVKGQVARELERRTGQAREAGEAGD
jgi:hypothetical protein